MIRQSLSSKWLWRTYFKGMCTNKFTNLIVYNLWHIKRSRVMGLIYSQKNHFVHYDEHKHLGITIWITYMTVKKHCWRRANFPEKYMKCPHSGYIGGNSVSRLVEQSVYIQVRWPYRCKALLVLSTKLYRWLVRQRYSSRSPKSNISNVTKIFRTIQNINTKQINNNSRCGTVFT